jgi:hypothetical protein
MNDLYHGVLNLASAAAARAGSARAESESDSGWRTRAAILNVCVVRAMKATSYGAEDEEGEQEKRKHRRGAERRAERRERMNATT